MIKVNEDKFTLEQEQFWKYYFHAMFEQFKAFAKHESRQIKTIKFFMETMNDCDTLFAFSLDTDDTPIHNIAVACSPEMVHMPSEDFISPATQDEMATVLNDFAHQPTVFI